MSNSKNPNTSQPLGHPRSPQQRLDNVLWWEEELLVAQQGMRLTGISMARLQCCRPGSV